jgi:hypothetical protein
MKNHGEVLQHYKLFPDSEMEALDIIKYALTPEEYKGFLKGNILKYRLRAGKKDDIMKEMNKVKDYESELARVCVSTSEPMGSSESPYVYYDTKTGTYKKAEAGQVIRTDTLP